MALTVSQCSRKCWKIFYHQSTYSTFIRNQVRTIAEDSLHPNQFVSNKIIPDDKLRLICVGSGFLLLCSDRYDCAVFLVLLQSNARTINEPNSTEPKPKKRASYINNLYSYECVTLSQSHFHDCCRLRRDAHTPHKPRTRAHI